MESVEEALKHREAEPAQAEADLSANQGTAGKSVDQKNTLVVLFCSLIVVLYLTHIYIALTKERSQNVRNKNGVLYVEFKQELDKADGWTFFLVTLVLPLGISLVSIFFSTGGVARAESPSYAFITALSAYHFSRSVFILMITLEITYWYNLVQNDWQRMLSGALIIDFISYLGFTLIGEPVDPKRYEGVFIGLFIGLSGAASFLSSFITIYYSKLFDLFALADHGPQKVEYLAPGNSGDVNEGDAGNALQAA